MRNIYVAQPMKYLSYEEIEQERRPVVKICKECGFDIINNMYLENGQINDIDYILKSLDTVAWKPYMLVVFLDGWQDERNCRIMRNWCIEYNIEFMDDKTFFERFGGVKKEMKMKIEEEDKNILEATYQKKFKNKEEWLEYRRKGIGGSDASCILGTNLYKSNVELYTEKVGEHMLSVDDNVAMKFGRDCEPILKNLFMKDFPEIIELPKQDYELDIHPKYPFILGSLDAKIMRIKKYAQNILHSEYEKGFLEIKTATPRTSLDWDKWTDGRVPQNYLSQITHYFLVGDGKYTFAFLRVYLKSVEYKKDDIVLKPFQNTGYIRDYYFEYDVEMQKATAYLLEKEKEFWNCVEQKKQPDLILPIL